MNEKIKNNIWDKIVRDLIDKVKNQDVDEVTKNQLLDLHGVIRKKQLLS